MYPKIEIETGKAKPVWKGVDAFITSINNCVASLGENTTKDEDNDILNMLDPPFILYMSPDAVKDYMERIWGAKAVISQTGALGGNCIVGVARPGLINAYNNLTHWMYKHNNTFWSWGYSFNSVQAANLEYKVVYTIEVTLT
jgi:hypothetical protein